MFPPYALGNAYLVTRDLVPSMHRTALQQTFMRIEDVFLTGVLAELLGGVPLIHSGDFHYCVVGDDGERCCTLQSAVSLNSFANHNLMYKWYAELTQEGPDCDCGKGATTLDRRK
jgi:hypothetical protein